ncbi:MAG TPA: MEDS domain-containing protein [Kofleriaceae bacterium]|nr:MEDS domain-containing protein [Kofleriaceae bacterium]
MATPSGIPVLGDLPPGSHIGQFYWDQHDLLETLVPFFATGLRQNERCIWVCSQPLCAAEARSALAKVVYNLAELERKGQIAIVDHDAWYVQRGELTTGRVIQGWLDAERDALQSGYRGLRINGNLMWVPPEQWSQLADYEAQAHTAFRDRAIVALCSYPLSKCGAHQIVDVLHNHGASLVRNGSGWGLVHGATAALASLDTEHFLARAEQSHSVEFYRDRFPIDRVAARLHDALDRGVGAAALVMREHGNALRSELLRRDVDVNAAIGRGQLAILDADAVFEAAWTRPGVRLQVVIEAVRTPISAIIERYGSCAAYGELVDLFARNGDRDAAIALERWWNDQLLTLPIDLACGYSLASFDDASTVAQFKTVCNEHRDVGIDGAVTASEADRLRVELAQMTNALAREMARRQVIEAAYATARKAREHLVLLNRLTTALGEVTSRAQFADLVRDLVVRTLDAAAIVLVEVDSREPLVCEGFGAESLCQAALVPTTRARWSNRMPEPAGNTELRAYAVLPVMVGSRRVATLALGFAHDRELSAPYRGLTDDVARQLALALDRAISYERLEHERKRAESGSRAKDEFLAMLGHELRNPLSPILTATQLMRLRGEDVFEKERTVIERQCRHMIRLVDDLLDVSRITRGKVELRRRPIEICEVVAQAVEQVSPAMEERAHRLTIDVPKSGLVVHADPARLAQVIGNLLTNAAKYTPHGGAITVAVRATGSAVAIAVRDTGIGIDPKLLPQVFGLFIQGRQGIDRAAGGLGLGLAIAKTLVELHGGTIHARSQGAGQGSEFVVELPRYANTRPAQRSNNSGAFVLAGIRPFRVLVVDDNEDAAFLFAEALRKLGHKVDVANDGPSALAVARQNPPEIAFLDIGLPVMDGYELGRRLREIEGAPPKLVAVTGYGHSSDRERSLDAGFALHLVKPVDLTAIQDALAKLCT